MQVEDLDLVKDILKGNIDSFNLIIYKYEAPIYRFILAMIKNPEDAKDLTQEVFITLYNKLYTYRGKSKFSSWLYQIARNRCLDYLKRNKKVIQLSIENAWDISSKEPLPEQVMELNETRKELQRFVKGLDDITRQILILRGLREDLRFDDIAEILNVNVSTVKTKYYRLWDKYSNFVKEKRCEEL